MPFQALTDEVLRSLPALLRLTWPFWATLGGVLLLRLAAPVYRRARLARCGIRQIDRMDGKSFEEFLEGLFRRLGYHVERTPCSGDYGADLILTRKGETAVVQAKRKRGSVGVRAVQEAVAATGYYDCELAMVVTNSRYTDCAIELADANEVLLWDRDDLIEVLTHPHRFRGRVFLFRDDD